MFDWLFTKRSKRFEEDTKQAFTSVRKDMDLVGKWIKHLDGKNKQVFEELSLIKMDLSSIKEELDGLREALVEVNESQKNKQVFEETPVFEKQTPVFDVEKAVQTGVQTAEIIDILKSLSSNERLLVFTLLQSDLKLSYEDLALLLGKERSTVRGQVNSIKQKSDGLILEITEKNGKKRVYIPDEMKEKLAKYSKVRVARRTKVRVN